MAARRVLIRRAAAARQSFTPKCECVSDHLAKLGSNGFVFGGFGQVVFGFMPGGCGFSFLSLPFPCPALSSSLFLCPGSEAGRKAHKNIHSTPFHKSFLPQ